MTKNAYITLSDRFHYEILTKEYCDETFGEDYIQDYGIEIPEDLLIRYKANQLEFKLIQNELRDIVKKNANKI